MRYCPECRAEYRDEVITCSDDGALLVDRKPQAEPTIARLASVLTLDDRFEAQELAQGLQEEGLEVSLVSNRGVVLGTLTAPGPETLAIVVPEADAERARALLAEWRPGYEAQQAEAEAQAEREATADSAV